jgi:cytochrome P450
MPKAIYPAILANPDVPLLEKSQSRLEDDAIFLMFAGTDAPSQTIAITMFHILNNPRIYQRLKNELFAAISDITTAPSLDQLEKISYLASGLPT